MYKNKRYLILVMAALCFLFIGVLYAWSNFIAPIEDEFGWNRAQTSIAYTFAMVFFSGGMTIRGLFGPKKHKRAAAIAVAFLMSAALALCSIANSLLWLCVFYGIIFGFSVGYIYNEWVALVMRWFPEKAGFASGTIMISFGISAFAFSFFVPSLLGENGIGWRNTFLVLAGVLLVSNLGTLMFLNEPPETISLSQKETKRSQYEVAPKQVLRSWPFWNFSIWRGMLWGIGTSVMGHAAMIALETGASIEIAAFAVGALSVGNSVIRLPLGLFHDKFGTVKTLIFISFLFLLSCALILVAYIHRMTGLAVCALLLTGAGLGGVAMEIPAFTNDVFGNQSVQANIGINALTTIPVIIIGSSLISLIYTNTGSYTLFFYISIAMCLVSIACAFVMRNAIFKMRQKLDILNKE